MKTLLVSSCTPQILPRMQLNVSLWLAKRLEFKVVGLRFKLRQALSLRRSLSVHSRSDAPWSAYHERHRKGENDFPCSLSEDEQVDLELIPPSRRGKLTMKTKSSRLRKLRLMMLSGRGQGSLNFLLQLSHLRICRTHVRSLARTDADATARTHLTSVHTHTK